MGRFNSVLAAMHIWRRTVVIILVGILVYVISYCLTFRVEDERASGVSLCIIKAKIDGKDVQTQVEDISYSGPGPRDWFSDFGSNHDWAIRVIYYAYLPLLNIDIWFHETRYNWARS